LPEDLDVSKIGEQKFQNILYKLSKRETGLKPEVHSRRKRVPIIPMVLAKAVKFTTLASSRCDPKNSIVNGILQMSSVNPLIVMNFAKSSNGVSELAKTVTSGFRTVTNSD
jgi:hypothetical protein